VAHDVFISYASRDKPVADAVCAALEGRGIRCWIAPRDILPGLDWGAAIIGAITDCRVMILVFSSHANRSPQISREVERAVSKGITIIPLRIEDVPPAKSLEYFISTPHWLDALSRPIERHLDPLADTVQLLLARGSRDSTDIAVAPPPPRPAPAMVSSPTPAAPSLPRRETDAPAVRRRSRPLVWAVAAAALLLLAAIFYPRGSPPEIVQLRFPDSIGTSRGGSGSIEFRDEEGDVVSAQFDVVEASEFQPIRIDVPANGQKAGRLPFSLQSAVPQKVTLEATLIDRAGRRSDPVRFSFEVKRASTGKRPSFTVDTPHFRFRVP
jgi:hypothetical protein